MQTDADKTYQIRTGEEFDIDFLPRVMEIDVAIAVLFRYVESVWNYVYFYSEPGKTPFQNLHEALIYSGGYIGAELILTLVLLLIPQVREAIEYLKEVANHPYTEKYDFF